MSSDPLEVVADDLEATEMEHPVSTAMRDLRKALGVTQEDMARIIDIPVSMIALMESGRRVNPSWSTLAKIIASTGCNPSKFFPRTLHEGLAKDV